MEYGLHNGLQRKPESVGWLEHDDEKNHTSFIHTNIQTLINQFIHSFIRLFVRSFIMNSQRGQIANAIYKIGTTIKRYLTKI